MSGRVVHMVNHAIELVVQSSKGLEFVFLQHILFHMFQTQVEISKGSDIQDADGSICRVEDGIFGMVTDVQPQNILVN